MSALVSGCVSSLAICVPESAARSIPRYWFRLMRLEPALCCVESWAMPTSMGALVLGATWESASGLRLPYLVQYVAMVPYTVLLAYYRSAQANQLSTLMRATLAMLTLVLPLALAYAGGTVASAWAFALAVAVAAVVGGIATIVSRSRSRAQSARAQSASHGPDPVEVELRPAADAR